MDSDLTKTHEALLRRRGLVFMETTGEPVPEQLIQAVEIKLADLGYALSTRLRDRLQRASVAELTRLQEWIWATLAAQLGADQKHVPLFRKFPHDIPDDTLELWIRKVACHFLQAPDQPCLFCRLVGTTHVLSPCHHVVCDRCFDGSNYSACPVCEHHVDTTSPFFKPSPADERILPGERIRFKLLDLGRRIDDEARALFVSFCARKQALSPTDREDFTALLNDGREHVLPWIPETIPLKENVATVFGTLFSLCTPETILPAARAHLKTATDVLRFIAAFSGADPSLQRQTVFKTVERTVEPNRWWGKIVQLLGADVPGPVTRPVTIPIRVNRFKVAPLRRALRRSLLSILDDLNPDLLVEDMLRHRSYWVWVGQFLHPHEYARRFPNVARAFAIVRKQGPDGTPAPAFRTYHSKLEETVRAGEVEQMTRLLLERPGELARRFDHALRVAGDDPKETDRVVGAFTSSVGAFSTPVLLTLYAMLPTRTERAKIRIYWPKGQVAKGVSSPDERSVLRADAIRPAVQSIETELLRRFGGQPAVDTCIIDAELEQIMVPFNERTASPAAVALPRGSRVKVPTPEGGTSRRGATPKVARLFLHWCQPETGGYTTDLDLSVGLYDASWAYVGVCSYYQLKYPKGRREPIAISAGDLQDAPYPDGATEFIDLHLDRALERGIRYAVMVVNAYAGMPFSRLERGFAGLMLRDDVEGKHFDPRTVELRFNLQGENGIFMPLVFDVKQSTLHWVDTHSKGQFEFNNVASSNAAIQTICPELIEYFASGVRMSMYELALLHAAARSTEVYIRAGGAGHRLFVRREGEHDGSFLGRIAEGIGAQNVPDLSLGGRRVLAALYRGDIDLPEGTDCYALFRERVAPTLAASDLIV